MNLLAERYRVELDRALSLQNGVHPIQRIVPRYPQAGSFMSRTRFKIGATVYFDGKAYAAELHHNRRDQIDVILWRNGRRVQEAHLLDVRHAVTSAYCETFGLEAVIKLGVGTLYRRKAGAPVTGVTL